MDESGNEELDPERYGTLVLQPLFLVLLGSMLEFAWTEFLTHRVGK